MEGTCLQRGILWAVDPEGLHTHRSCIGAILKVNSQARNEECAHRAKQISIFQKCVKFVGCQNSVI